MIQNTNRPDPNHHFWQPITLNSPSFFSRAPVYFGTAKPPALQSTIVFIHTPGTHKQLKPYKTLILVLGFFTATQNAGLEAIYPIFCMCFSYLEAPREQEALSSSTNPAFLSSTNLQSLLRLLQGTPVFNLVSQIVKCAIFFSKLAKTQCC